MASYRNQIVGNIDANTSTLTLPYRHFSNGAVALQVTGTWTGTLRIQISLDGTNFVDLLNTNNAGTSATDITANGYYRAEAVGALSLRVNRQAWTSGTAVCTLVGLDG
jgi:hypothetical protein